VTIDFGGAGVSQPVEDGAENEGTTTAPAAPAAPARRKAPKGLLQ
jgi:hypothetical protein